MNKMAKKMVTRRELLDRWRGIEEEDDEDDAFSDPLKRRRFQQLKEQWFSDAFNFLIYLPEGNHIWCGAWELMGPLLETFYNYFQENEHHDSPLKLLWTRISKEMRCCTQCIYQHHQAQEMYDREYERNLIGPLLDVLRTLDEERITQHLKEMNMKIAKKEYDPVQDNCEVVNVMFEVLTYPVLLEDQSLSTEFQTFIEAIDDSHELTLAGHQHYPGVYALLFLKSRRVRSIGFRLAGQMGKLRRSTDLDPLQPSLKKCIGLLETDVMPSAIDSSRPRVQLERTTVWLGIKALLGFLEPPAFEEGILDHYPIFLSIVLNHISDDSAEFSYAVNCLRLLFEMLGCKLWLRSTLSPSVMRNTLLGQCFHTRNEKSHKEIFDLFLPFLQSLEALHDGEHEKQRRHFIYFLLHQVTVSSNFSTLMRKKACQIAFLIVHRGYTMNPPSPPFEYAHMWGPPLVSSLKDPSLHSSLRQPAFDLIQTIIVSDASALVTSILKCELLQSSGKDMSADFNSEEDDEEILFDHRFEENDVNCWDGFSMQSRITSRVYGGWMCIPMLWLDVLVEIDPLMLPLSFAKTVVWALSRFSMVEAENSTEVALSVRDCLTTCASEISHLFGWKVPLGYDDGGDGTELKNSIPISKMCMPLLRTFKRLTTMYIVRMEEGELRKQWMWEPMMGDSLILLLVDPNDDARQAGRHILEQVSATRDLTSGLQFLCASPFSLSAIFLGLRHALKLVQFDCVLSKFQHLHHFFFVLCKLLREGNPYTKNMLINSAGVPDVSKFSCQGGFLKPPEFDTSLDNVDRHSSVVNTVLWEKFSFLLSEIAWISIRKSLAQGKAFIDKKISQMTCIRLLEVLPVVFERLCGSSNIMLESIIDLKWLYDLIEWGKSPLAVVVRYWKQALVSLLGLIRVSFSHNAVSAINNIEKLISCDELAMDEIVQELGFLSVSLMDEGGFASKKSNLKSKLLLSTDLMQGNNCSLEDRKTVLLEKAKVHAPDSEVIVNEDKGNMIILSDDEKEPDIPGNQGIQSVVGSNWFMSDDESGGHDKSGIGDPLKKGDSRMNGFRSLMGVSHHEGASDVSDKTCQKLHSTRMDGRKGFAGNVKVTSFGDKKIEISTKLSANSLTVQDKSNYKNSCEQPVNLKSSSDKSLGIKSRDQEQIDKVAETSNALIKNLVRDEEDDSWEFTFFKSAKAQQSLVSKPSASIPKRKVIQLDLPVKNRSGSLKPDVGMKRFKPLRLDDWYRPILELDFFATVGLASAADEDNRKATMLKEIPVSFQSPEEYIQIFQPLVLEEFKAQLLSSFQEMSSPEEICGGSLSVMSIERIDDFHIVRCVHDESGSSGSGSLSENDLILLTRQPLQSSSHDVHMIGKVDRREKDDKRKSCIVVIRLYLQNGSSRLNRARKFLAERSKWCISRLMNITPQLREFQALSSIKQIPLLPIILNPIKHPSGHHESKKEHLSKLPQPLQHVLKSSYNDSQLQAIGAAVGPFNFKKNFELSLIQGPPGTGKTRTIVAIVSSFLAFPQDRDSKRSLHGSSNANMRPQISPSAAIARAWQEAALARQINNDAEKCIENCIRRRILICAQSNAAVDELVSRISSEGIYGSDGATYKPYLVRVGNPKTIHPNSLPCFIDTLVDRRLAEQRKEVSDEKNENSCDSLTVMRSTLEKLVDRIRFYEAKRANLRDGSLDHIGLLVDGEGVQEDENKKYSYAELEAKLRTLYEKKKILYKDLATAQAREKKASEESKALRYKLRKAILKEAELVVTTLSGCGGDLYGVCSESISSHKFSSSAENTLFDAVVIDEAAQALEPATLIPLQLLKSLGTRCIMVGDPKQLPATVLSNTASKYLFQCSMFERLQRAGHPVIMLTQQYRMHPEICHFPSLHFYENKLLNGDQMSSKSAAFHETEGLGPYVFFDIMDGQELHGKSAGTLSLYNESEADAAVEVLRFFKKRYPSEFSGRRIGVITPYKCQLSLLRSRFSSAFGSSIAADMEFNTVDGFQGREVDILILSTVRAAERRSETPRVNSSRIGFVADVRRMNVSLTRAKLSLWILGNARTLRTDQNWAALLRDAQQRNLVLSVSRPYSSIFQSAFRRNTIPESRGKQHDEMVKTVGDHAVQKNLKDTQERGRNFVGSGAPVDFVTNKREWESSTSRDAIKGIKRKARDKYDYSLEKDLGSVVVKKESGRSSKGLKSVGREHPVNSDKNMARIRNQQINMRRGHDSKGKSHDDSDRNFEPFKQLKVESSRQLKSVESRQCPINHDKNQQSSKTVRTSSEGSLEKADGDDGHKPSNQVELPKDTIATRKQQRDAVDALLSSALLSSKKTESSLKSMPSRRKSTPTHATRMPKPRKGPTRSSSCGMDDQTRHP